MEKVLIKKVLLNDNYDLIIEVFSKEQNKNIKWLIRKTDFDFKGLPIQESMNNLRDAWNLHVGKEINVNIINADEFSTSSINNEILDPSIRRQFQDIEYDQEDLEYDLSLILKENQKKFESNINRLNELFQKIEENLDEEPIDISNNKISDKKFFF